MLRIILLAILIVLIARAFWKVVDGVLEAGRSPATRRRGAAPVKLVRDPVCGTFVAPTSALSLTASGTTHYFCSEDCRSSWRERR